MLLRVCKLNPYNAKHVCISVSITLKLSKFITFGTKTQRSIQLSYKCKEMILQNLKIYIKKRILKRVKKNSLDIDITLFLTGVLKLVLNKRNALITIMSVQLISDGIVGL
jgi:hypothetical protein